MSYIRFATTCDHCGERSEEYTAWPECAECLADLCPNCYVPGSLVEGDGERRDRVMCHECKLEATA
jgi:hypothetical protein